MTETTDAITAHHAELPATLPARTSGKATV